MIGGVRGNQVVHHQNVTACATMNISLELRSDVRLPGFHMSAIKILTNTVHAHVCKASHDEIQNMMKNRILDLKQSSWGKNISIICDKDCA